jgi:hypothetical protein
MNRPIAAALLLLAACQPAASRTPEGPVSSGMPVPPGAPFAPTPDCPILGSSTWAAWVDAMPGPGSHPTLVVTGKVEVPTGGYQLALRLDNAAEHVVRLEATPPSGPATQAIITHDVHGNWSVESPVDAVTIRCGRQVIGVITEIATAL